MSAVLAPTHVRPGAAGCSDSLPDAHAARPLPALVRTERPSVMRVRSPLHAATVELLGRADEALLHACAARTVAQRYAAAHLAALRAAAAVLAQRASLGGGRGSVWGLLARTAPELTEWAEFFATAGQVRAALDAGTLQASVRQADDLVREAERFITAVHRALDIHVVVDP